MLRTKHGVAEIRHSNEHQQFQNALVEKCVDSLGKMIRAMLLQSQLPPEFWGCATMFSTDLANCRPHDSLGGGCTPFYKQYGILPDYSFFRPFGCQMIIHRGACLIELGKLAPRGKNAVYIGTGMTASTDTTAMSLVLNSRYYTTTCPTHPSRILPITFKTKLCPTTQSGRSPFSKCQQLLKPPYLTAGTAPTAGTHRSVGS